MGRNDSGWCFKDRRSKRIVEAVLSSLIMMGGNKKSGDKPVDDSRRGSHLFEGCQDHHISISGGKGPPGIQGRGSMEVH